jgi:hypothetical protein
LTQTFGSVLLFQINKIYWTHYYLLEKSDSYLAKNFLQKLRKQLQNQNSENILTVTPFKKCFQHLSPFAPVGVFTNGFSLIVGGKHPTTAQNSK